MASAGPGAAGAPLSVTGSPTQGPLVALLAGLAVTSIGLIVIRRAAAVRAPGDT